MAPTETTESSADEQSFTKMATADVEGIGTHCEMTFCHQLDFLPFRCESCNGQFCLDHRTESAHSCTQPGAWAQRKRQAQLSSSSSSSSTPKPSILNHEQQCSDPSCKTLINTPLTQGVHCPNCNRNYCLKHRMREDHNCANLVPLGARPGNSQREKGLAALEKLRAWGAAKQKSLGASMPKVPQSSAKANAAAAFKELNELKRTAKGDAKVPMDQRIYLYIKPNLDTPVEQDRGTPFFYHKDWKIGRVLDMAAKELHVQNVNNKVEREEERLNLYRFRVKTPLDFGKEVGDVCQNGFVLALFKGLPPADPGWV